MGYETETVTGLIEIIIMCYIFDSALIVIMIKGNE